MNMYSKDMLVGILLASARPEIQIIRDDNSNIGYRVRLKVIIRGREKFLKAIKRSLLQHEITSSLALEESKARPKPILRIAGIKNIYKLNGLIDIGVWDRNNLWPEFRDAIDIVSNGEHLTLEGLEHLFAIKGLI